MSNTTEQRDALINRLFQATLGTWDLLALYLGDRLGFYRALVNGPLTSTELAAATGTHERYVREWLEQQAAGGILDVDDAHADAADRRYELPPGHAEALLDESSLNYIAPIGKLVVACTQPLDALLAAFRTGDGVPYAEYGADLHEGQADFTRPMFEALLGTEWLPAISDVDVRLRSDPPARVADVACGEGYSSLHDMSYPVQVLGACRELLGEGGSVLIADERVANSLTVSGDDLERFYYGFSILHCLPVGMVGEGAAGTGTVMRADTVRRYAEQAGFRTFEILPIENDFYRFYRLMP